MRMVRNKDLADIKKQLLAILEDRPTPKSPLRNKSSRPMPVDLETRLQLVRLSQVPDLDMQPVWPQSVERVMEEVVDERRRAGRLRAAGLSPTRTMLFVGPPGVGKTMTAHWCAQKLELPLMVLDLSAVMSSYLGRTGINLRNVLDYAKETDCVMLLDEIDTIAKSRNDPGEIGELKRLVNILLQEIDSWPVNNLLIAATNHPDLLDSALWRRFEKVVEFDLPDSDQIKQSVSAFMGSGTEKISPEAIDVISFALAGKSYSYLKDFCDDIKKQSVLSGRSLDEVVQQKLSGLLPDMGKQEKKHLAVYLCSRGHSQRKSSDITGLSRSTIRKVV